ncbi:MAG: hypothetical protein ABIG63_02785 [Chloroflexota bacterium]
MSTHPPHINYSQFFVGLEVEIPLLGGRRQQYINWVCFILFEVRHFAG